MTAERRPGTKSLGYGGDPSTIALQGAHHRRYLAFAVLLERDMTRSSSHLYFLSRRLVLVIEGSDNVVLSLPSTLQRSLLSWRQHPYYVLSLRSSSFFEDPYI